MLQWCCKLCGEWVDATYYRHMHVQERELALLELMAARERGEMPDMVIGDVVYDTWTLQHAKREKPVNDDT